MKFIQLLFFSLVALIAQGVFAAQANADDVSAEQANPEVIFETNMGSFTLELYPDKAPETVANFLEYVDDGFYNNTIFHRVIPNFMIQGGGLEPGMKRKETRAPVKNESSNRLKNLRGTISMARKTHPDTGTSQFFINVVDNSNLDYKAAYQPGYAVFGKVTGGMDVIDKIVQVPTKSEGNLRDVPKEDVIVLGAKRGSPTVAEGGGEKTGAAAQKQEGFVAGEHYVVLDKPVATRDPSKIEVVELFSYACPHCYEFEPLIKEWGKQQAGDVDFWFFPAVWNRPMKLYAGAFYAARELNVLEKIHNPLFTAIVIEQKNVGNESDLADFFASYGIDKQAFTEAFNSTAVENQVKQAEARTRSYKLAGVPEVVVNGKYRVDRMRAGGYKEMLAVVDFLINKERTTQQ